MKSSSSKSSKTSGEIVSVVVCGQPIGMELTSFGIGNSVLMLGDVGVLTLASNGLSLDFTSTGGATPSLNIRLPGEVVLTKGLSFQLGEIILNQVAAATQGSCATTDFDAPCYLGCFDLQAQCYEQFGCNGNSWARSICEPYLAESVNEDGTPSSQTITVDAVVCTGELFYLSGVCAKCNAAVTSCIATGC